MQLNILFPPHCETGISSQKDEVKILCMGGMDKQRLSVFLACMPVRGMQTVHDKPYFPGQKAPRTFRKESITGILTKVRGHRLTFLNLPHIIGQTQVFLSLLRTYLL